MTLTPFGKHSVRATARFAQRPRGGPRVMRDDGRWHVASGGYLVPCRPLSQHGSVCLVRPTAGGLAVDVIAFGAGGRSRGVVESLVAPRCR